MLKQKSDFHVHTTFSDGKLSAIGVLQLAKRKGIKVLSITDHNTAQAYSTPGIVQTAKSLGITLVPGIEVSTNFNGRELDLLCYGYDPQDPAFKQFVRRLQDLHHEYCRKISEKLQRFGFQIDFPSLEKKYGRLNRDTLFYEITSNPNNQHALARMNLSKKSQEDALDDFVFERIGNSKSSYFVPNGLISTADAINLSHHSKAIAILAHPFVYVTNRLADRRKVEAIIAELKKLGIDGIETHYWDHSHRERQALEKLSRKYRLLRSRGSDFHQKAPNLRELGKTAGRRKDFLAKKMKERIEKIRRQK